MYEYSGIAKEASLYFNSEFIFTDIIAYCECEDKSVDFDYSLKIPSEEEYFAYKKWKINDLIFFFLKNAKLNSVQCECISSFFPDKIMSDVESAFAKLSELKISFDDVNQAIVFFGKKGLIFLINNMINKFLNEVSFTYQQFVLLKDSIKNNIAFLQPFASNELSCFVQKWTFQNLRNE